MKTLAFPASERPLISVVVVTFGDDVEVIRVALEALAKHTDVPYELVIVDNDPERTRPALDWVAGATVVTNVENRGFAAACNQGALWARGRHILFMNPDVYVRAGWAGPLMEVLEEDKRVGTCGPLILYPDERLQLAGALLANSGSTTMYGERDRPDRPEYGFRRVVDYLSGACLLVRRSAFDSVGGFDAAFGRAYFEDADLGVTLAADGWRSVYEPRSVVVHVGGASGTAATLGEQARRNRGIFEERWRGVLRSRPYSPLAASERRLAASRDAPASCRILVLAGHEAALQALELCPGARVTAVGTREDSSVDLAARGIEAFPADALGALLESRRFHYDAVLGVTPDAAEPLALTQPQALLVGRPEELPAAGCA
ncbi:MAG: glycosyltransferase family 2 protein [Gaiellaceae bacterium]